MDKNVDAPVDLLAFEGKTAKFWLEAKCDFAADECQIKRSARQAMTQVLSYAQELPSPLRRCPGYIVHFLCPLPESEQYPDWVEAFDPLTMNREYTPALLKAYYREYGRNGRRQLIHRIQSLCIDFEPQVGVVIIEFSTQRLRAVCRNII